MTIGLWNGIYDDLNTSAYANSTAYKKNPVRNLYHDFYIFTFFQAQYRKLNMSFTLGA